MNTPNHCSRCTSCTIRYCSPCNDWFCRQCWDIAHKSLSLPPHQPVLPPPERIRAGFGIVNAGATHTFAMKRWLEHATFRVLTFDSSSCLTLVATLRDDTEPFFFTHTRPDDPMFAKPVRTMLVKLMLTNPTITKQLNYTNKQLGKNGKYINVQPTNAFTSECAVQRDICQRSMANHPCDPVCPFIYWSTIAKEDKSNYYKSIFLSGLGDDNETKRIVEGFFYAQNAKNTQNTQNAKNTQNTQNTKNTQKHHPSIICMEWLEGYQTFKQHWNKKTGVDFSTLSDELAYEMMRLLSCGYIHTDLNIENIMYRPDTEGGKECGKGKLQLIDFGRVRRTTPVPIEEAFSHVTRQQIFATNAMPFPDEENVREMIQRQCVQKKKTNVQLLAYGITYQKDITTHGYDHTSVSSICAFLKDTYYEWLG
jgi:hypothetical protein